MQDIKRDADFEKKVLMINSILALKADDHNKLFWQERGWIDKPYYYDCKMNPMKILFSKAIYKVLYKVMDE